jgi:hypothetical protein
VGSPARAAKHHDSHKLGWIIKEIPICALAFTVFPHILQLMEIRMTQERRRAVFETILKKTEERGDKFEDDPGFRASVEEWITGTIEISELWERYRALCKMRQSVKAMIRSKPK